jgi:hypothetical protein
VRRSRATSILQDLKAGAMFQLPRSRARPSMPAHQNIWSLVNDEVTNLFTAPPNLAEPESRIGIEKQLLGEIELRNCRGWLA